MTENEKDFNATHVADREMAPARLQCCKECPFRKENHNREHPDNSQYTPQKFSSVWRDVSQDGAAFGCHMWDGDLYGYDDAVKAAGYHKPVDVGTRIECAGMVAMVERELDIADESPSYGEYHRKRPQGMSKQAILVYSARRRGETGPELRFSAHVNRDDILDPHDVVDPDSTSWSFDEEQSDVILRTAQAVLPGIRECHCEMCDGHAEVHPSRDLTTAESLTVAVDAAMYPLLAVLAAAGIRTTDSCINLYEVVMAVRPDHYAAMTNGSRIGTMNYGTTLRRRHAFVRLRNGSAAEDRFIAAAEAMPEIEVVISGALTQLVFPQDSIPALMEAAQR